MAFTLQALQDADEAGPSVPGPNAVAEELKMAAGADATADSDAPEATAKKGGDADGKKGKKAKNRKRKSQPVRISHSLQLHFRAV